MLIGEKDIIYFFYVLRNEKMLSMSSFDLEGNVCGGVMVGVAIVSSSFPLVFLTEPFGMECSALEFCIWTCIIVCDICIRYCDDWSSSSFLSFARCLFLRASHVKGSRIALPISDLRLPFVVDLSCISQTLLSLDKTGLRIALSNYNSLSQKMVVPVVPCYNNVAIFGSMIRHPS